MVVGSGPLGEWRRVADTVPDALFIHDTQGRILEANGLSYATFVYARDALLGLDLLILEQGADRRAQLADWAALAPGEVLTHCGVQVRPDGGTFPFERRVACIEVEGERLFVVASRDLASRPGVEAAEQLATLFEGSPLAEELAVLPEVRLLKVNRAWAELTGVEAPEAAGQTAFQLGLLPNPSLQARLVAEASARGQVRDVELTYRTRRLGTRSVSVSASIVQLGDRRCLLSQLHDVTRQREVEALAREEALRFRSLFERSMDAVYLTRSDGSVVDANDAACRLHGMTVEEIQARGRLGLVTPRANAEALLSERETRGQAIGRISVLRKDGSSVPVEVESVQVDPGRSGWNSFSIARDISRQLADEAAIRQLAAAVDQAPLSVTITDARGVILYVNPAFELVTGYSREEAVGRPTSFLKSGRHDDAFYRMLWSTITAGGVWRGRLVNRTKRGELVTEEAVISPIHDPDGAITRYVATKRDVTAELRTQEAREQAQRLQSIGRLAGGVAHDFNNVLSVILLCGELARAALPADHPVHEELKEILEAGGRARGLTRQLLAFSRTQVLEPQVLDLNRVLGGIERMLRRLLGADVTLRLHLAEDLWNVVADAVQLEQVVVNLAVNARDAMPSGGSLTLQTSNVMVEPGSEHSRSGEAPGLQVLLQVADTGTGMDEETRRRAFEPFFSTKGPRQGTGLGLSTVYGIVHQSGGSIQVDSELGAGTTFRIYLPRAPSGVVAAPPPKLAGELTGTETILVVDDDPAVGAACSRILAGAGYQVLLASNAGEALLQLEQHPARVDLVLTDVVMPLLSGPALVERLAQVRPGMRVLFMSGYPDDPRIGAASNAAFVAKPLTPRELLMRVRVALDTP